MKSIELKSTLILYIHYSDAINGVFSSVLFVVRSWSVRVLECWSVGVLETPINQYSTTPTLHLSMPREVREMAGNSKSPIITV